METDQQAITAVYETDFPPADEAPTQRKKFTAVLGGSADLDELMRGLTAIRQQTNDYLGQLIDQEKEREKQKKPRT
jgi:hypothetical protein